jgi:hypothetical protein
MAVSLDGKLAALKVVWMDIEKAFQLALLLVFWTVEILAETMADSWVLRSAVGMVILWVDEMDDELVDKWDVMTEIRGVASKAV